MIYLDRPTKRVKIVSLSCKTWCFWLNFTNKEHRHLRMLVPVSCCCRCRCRCCWCFYWFWFSKTPSTPRENKSTTSSVASGLSHDREVIAESSIGRVVTSPPRRSREPLEHTIPGDFANEKTNRLYCSCRWCCCCR